MNNFRTFALVLLLAGIVGGGVVGVAAAYTKSLTVPGLAQVPAAGVTWVHTPVAGTYTLLATYERPFKPQGETLAFTGARPLDAQSEQGHTIIISAYQFDVKKLPSQIILLQLFQIYLNVQFLLNP